MLKGSVTARAGGGSHAVLQPESKDIDFKKYNLVGLEIEAIDNGVMISCRYKIKQEPKSKEMDYETRYRNERHAFSSMEEAAEFVEARMLGKDYAAHEKKETGEKVKVRKV